MKIRLLTLILIGALLSALLPLPAPAQQVELNVGTSSVQPLPSPLPNQLNVLPPPPPFILRQISRESDPSTTVDMPLSLMGEQILNAVCEAEITPDLALSLMPDLSPLHIQHHCPERWTSETLGTPAMIGSSTPEPDEMLLQ